MTEKGFIRNGQSSYYVIQRPVSPDEIIAKAKHIIACRLRRGTDVLSSPERVRDYLTLHLGGLEREQFWGVFLDNRHRVISREMLFEGTIDSATVYPREVIKLTLQMNAQAVIFAHNHPSGVAEPSDTDIRLTRKLTDALATIDARVLDHLVIGGDTITSFAERGLI